MFEQHLVNGKSSIKIFGEMQDLGKLREKIQKGQTIQLSSDFTKGGTYITIGISIIAAIFLTPKILDSSEGLQTNILLAGVMLLVLVALAIYQLLYAAEAELRGKKLTLKKITGKEFVIDVNQVNKTSSFQSRSTKYTILKFVDGSGNPETALIMNSNSILFGKEVTAGEVVKLAQQL
ncbi:hypothetical protein [Lewinella sp. W8]|uniref:hypothetical protein n=1 Tax=Lewinella sp. W8 TaxID=2528208 RepID=UPI0010676292|nr:hypothetical protein [Lewinella sp. W8]MTB51713.1 hypothetical protein [Lewinella sp. W8]